MPGEIQKIPQGLLGFLQLKTGGRNPSILADAVSPTWDLSRLYLEADARFESVNSTINAGGYTIFFSSPQDRVRLVTSFAVGITTDAGETIQCCLCRAPSNNAVLASLTAERSIAASSWAQLPVLDPQYLQPGDSLGLLVNAVVGVVSVYGSIRYIDLPI